MALINVPDQPLFSGKLSKPPPPRKPKNADVRCREYLTPNEMALLIAVAGKQPRHGHRNKTLILVMYRHGLRVAELIALHWDQIDLDAGLIHINRLKNGTPSTHPLGGTEIRALRRLKRDYPATPFVFVSERKAPMTASNVRKLMAKTGQQAQLAFSVHPHMLRHACGFKLANDGQDTRAIQHYLGHKNIQHTVRYTELAADRFKDFWHE